MKSKWTCTDIDTMQHVKCTFNDNDYPEQYTYQLIEMGLVNPEKNLYEVYEDTLCVDDYLEAARGELSSILAGFGYGDDEEDCAIIIDRMAEQYGNEVFQVICECIFEHYGSFQASILFMGNEGECVDFIKKYIEEE